MTYRLMKLICTGLTAAAGAMVASSGCTDSVSPVLREIETGISLNNLNSEFYVALQVRPSSVGSRFATTSLLPPGGTSRERFLDLFGIPCPDRVDLRIFLYERINKELPIGLDVGEEVDVIPTAAASLLDVPICAAVEIDETAIVETFTVTVWELLDDAVRIKLAQSTPLETILLDAGFFSNEAESLWQFEGVEEDLERQPPPPLAEVIEITGRAINLDAFDDDENEGAAEIGVLLRSRFRNRLNDGDESNDPDAGFSAPIDVTTTDGDGFFRFTRPSGVYRIEFFADGVTFRPAVIDIEAPAGEIISLVESTP